MGQITLPNPAVLIAALIASDLSFIDRAKETLEDKFGEVCLESDVFPFTYTSYYREEMGGELIKQFICFRDLIQMDRLAEIKVATNHIEEELGVSIGGRLRRRVNIDPGYVSLSKLVLASTKDSDHRIYLGRGIFAEVTLRYRYGRFESLAWTYPDYRTDLARTFFAEVRKWLLARRRAGLSR